MSSAESHETYHSCTFTVWGTVQGVWFRKHTKEYADSINVVGTIRNTEEGTVHGIIQGNTENYEKMKYWLQHTGSPLSKIERAEFVDEKTIEKFDFDSFSILP